MIITGSASQQCKCWSPLASHHGDGKTECSAGKATIRHQLFSSTRPWWCQRDGSCSAGGACSLICVQHQGSHGQQCSVRLRPCGSAWTTGEPGLSACQVEETLLKLAPLLQGVPWGRFFPLSACLSSEGQAKMPKYSGRLWALRWRTYPAQATVCCRNWLWENLNEAFPLPDAKG